MVDDADADLLVGLVFAEQVQVLAVAAGTLEGDDISVQLQQMRHCAFVAGHFPVHALLVGVAPAGVHPDFRVDADKLAVESLGEEFEVGVSAIGTQRTAVVRWFLDLDQRAAGGGEFA
jgi:hypothetical protein